MCGKQESQNDGWARKSQQVAQCKAKRHLRRGGGIQQAIAPSHSLGEALSLKDTASSAVLLQRDPLVVIHMWRVPCCDLCSCTEARLHLSPQS